MRSGSGDSDLANDLGWDGAWRVAGLTGGHSVHRFACAWVPHFRYWGAVPRIDESSDKKADAIAFGMGLDRGRVFVAHEDRNCAVVALVHLRYLLVGRRCHRLCRRADGDPLDAAEVGRRRGCDTVGL